MKNSNSLIQTNGIACKNGSFNRIGKYMYLYQPCNSVTFPEDYEYDLSEVQIKIVSGIALVRVIVKGWTDYDINH